MKVPRILVAAVLAFSAGVSWAPTSEGGSDVIIVIVNPSNPASVLGVNDLRPIFQTMKTSWGTGGDALPVNLPEDNPLRHDFDQTVLGLDPERVARYWKDRKIRGGARAPLRVSNSGAMLKAVAAKAGAVGYVKASEVNATVKVVARIANGKLSGP
jgi:ABC-type phosphate transport system substrate-binding protein